VVQLLRWLLCFDVASVKPYLVAHIERQEGGSCTSHLLFILVLCDHELVVNVSVDIMKVKCGLVSLCGGDRLDVDLKIGVKPFIHKEWGDICGGVRGIVVCELCEREVGCPIVLQVINIDLEVLLENLVEVLSLTVSFRVIHSREVELNAEALHEGLPKVGDEECTTIGDDISWGTVFCDDPCNDEVSKPFGCKCCNGRNEETHLRESIHNDENGVRG
jgi:hypothetical protein